VDPGTASAGALQAGHSTAAYERLRAHVTRGAVAGALDRPSGGATAGLGLVLQQGVPGWLAALERVALATIAPAHRTAAGAAPGAASTEHGDPPSLPAIAAPVGPVEELLPLACHPDLTRLVASLVLSTQWPRAAVASAGPASQTITPGGVRC